MVTSSSNIYSQPYLYFNTVFHLVNKKYSVSSIKSGIFILVDIIFAFSKENYKLSILAL